MNRIWTVSLGLLATSVLMLSACDLNVAPKGYFNLKNGTDATLKILVSDNDQCIIGLHSEVATNTWRNYDIDNQTTGAWLCVDGKSQKVVNGESYVFESSFPLKVTEAPDTGGAGGLLDLL
jgi:hypothetical protein